MAERTHKKRPRDPSQLGKLIVDISVGEVDDRKPAPNLEGKDAAAVSLGRSVQCTPIEVLPSEHCLQAETSDTATHARVCTC